MDERAPLRHMMAKRRPEREAQRASQPEQL